MASFSLLPLSFCIHFLWILSFTTSQNENDKLCRRFPLFLHCVSVTNNQWGFVTMTTTPIWLFVFVLAMLVLLQLQVFHQGCGCGWMLQSHLTATRSLSSVYFSSCLMITQSDKQLPVFKQNEILLRFLVTLLMFIVSMRTKLYISPIQTPGVMPDWLLLEQGFLPVGAKLLSSRSSSEILISLHGYTCTSFHLNILNAPTADLAKVDLAFITAAALHLRAGLPPPPCPCRVKSTNSSRH